MTGSSVPARALLRIFVLASALVSATFARSQDSPHLRMGNPTHASADATHKNNFLLVKPFYALSYNNVKGTPNWVSWRLSREDLGTARRFPFKPDSDLPHGFKNILPSDYTGSGFDRGHMCPHSDRNGSLESSKATFVMTNMVPQSPENNQRAWNQLEIYLRDLVENHGEVCYIIAGPAGVGGVGRNGPAKKTPNGNVVVPAVTWKVVMVLDEDVNSPDQFNEDSHIRLFAAIVPNDSSPGEEWVGFRRTVDEVEALTGYTFFDLVPARILGNLKSEPDEVPIPPPSQFGHGGHG
jgi:endonuclease G, mitochondrial